ncbi:MAG: terminase small subunit [Nanoarchaeota archaeon]|nr:terminase small subunit [Nanoarchaeota archaeon]
MTEINLEQILELGKKAKLKVYHDFLQKIKKGEGLKPGELTVFNLLESEIREEEESRKANINFDLILSTSEIGAFFGVSRIAVHKWHKSGCPKIKYGKFDLKAVFDWWWLNIASYHTSEILDGSLEDARREYWQAKAEGMRLEVDKIKETLVSWNKIETEWCSRVAVVTSGLSAFADRLPPLLEGKARAEVQKIIKDEVWQLRDSYARKGKYTPTPIKPKKKGGDKRGRKRKGKPKK